MGEWIELLASLGVAATLLAIAKHYVDRWRWHKFKTNLNTWTDVILDSESLRPRTDDEWRAACETLLSEVRFSPFEVQQLLDASLAVAKGIAANKFMLED